MIRFAGDAETTQKIAQAIIDNQGYCPCKLEKTPDTLCMCKEFRDQPSGVCHCGLYIKTLSCT